ncbi:hypothetical protein EMN47_01845 [Prolixibacteraceae bacterium JC049]|nr:hypothetical protein [Prolixibacteraceae bacterium JC049]
MAIFLLPVIAYLLLQTKVVQSVIIDKIVASLSKNLNTEISIKSVDIGWYKLILSDVLIKDQQKDTLLYAKDVSCFIESWSDDNENFVLKSIQTTDVKTNIKRLKSSEEFNYQFLTEAMNDTTFSDTLSTDTISTPLKLICRDFIFNNSQVNFLDQKSKTPIDLQLNGVNIHVNDIAINDDSINFNLKNFTLKEQHGIEIRKLNGAVLLSENEISLKKVNLITKYSKIDLPQLQINSKRYNRTNNVGDLKLLFDLQSSYVSLTDIAMLVPDLKGMNLRVNLSGLISGRVDALRGKNIDINFGEESRLLGSFYLNGLTAPETSFLNLEVKEAATSFADISKIHLPNSAQSEQLNLPENLANAGLIKYRGSFTGFTTDFVAFGMLESDMGKIVSDLSFKPDSAKNIRFKGHLKTHNFQIEKLLPKSAIGAITLNGDINGIRPANGLTQAVVDGVIDSLDFNQYRLRNIQLKGDLNERKFDGKVEITDPNLAMDFRGKIDLNPETSEFNFTTNIKHANLAAIHLTGDDKTALLKSTVLANFKAKSIDNVLGAVSIVNTQYINENGTLNLKDFQLATKSTKQERMLTIQSDYVDGEVKGDYSFSSLSESVKHIIAQFLPSANLEKHEQNKPKNIFSYDFQIKDINSISKILQPNLQVKTPFNLIGQVDEKENNLVVKSFIPEITYNQLQAKNLELTSGKKDNHLKLKLRSKELAYASGLKLYNFSLHNDAINDTLKTNINWNNWHEKTYSGDIHFATVFNNDTLKSPVEFNILPSQVYVADSLWTLSRSKVNINAKDIDINHFALKQGNQQIKADGALSSDKTKRLNLKFDNIQLGVADHLIGAKSGLSGLLNGEAGVYDFWNEKLFYSDLTIKDFVIENYPIGDIELINKWDQTTSRIVSQLQVTENDTTRLNLEGHYDPAANQFDYHSVVDGVNMNVVNLTMDPESLSEIKGRAYGKLRVFGNWPDLKLEGALLGQNSSIKINFLNTHYTFSDTVYFTPDRLIFDKIVISDEKGRKGLFDGDIKHEYFSNMKYNLNITTDDMLILNTTASDNEKFYGTAYAQGIVNIGGKGKLVKIGGQVRTKKGTEIYIPVDDNEYIAESSFVHFKDSKSNKAEKAQETYQTEGVEVNIDLIPTTDAQIQILMDSYYGGILKGSGTGNLKLQMDRFGVFEMYGDVKVDRGTFKFSLLNVVNKNFTINPGGTLHWNGDPYEANINLSGIYKLRASIKDLPLAELIGIDPQQDIQRSRIPVECQINLDGMLSSPNIKFGIELPSAEPQVKDAFQMMISNQEDLNRQILMLLAMRRFYTPPQYQTTTGRGINNSDIVNTSAGELISNQLSNWLSQISDDWSWGINYRPGTDEITSDEVEVALSTQFFNNRLVVNGNLGNSTSNNKNDKTLTGDFDVIFKWTNKLQLKAFSRTNDNLIYDSSPTTQGIGISYREDFNSWSELFKRYTKWLSKPKKNKSKVTDKLASD